MASLLSGLIGRLGIGRLGGPVRARSNPRSLTAKASAAGPLIALHQQGMPVWTPRDFHGFAQEGFARNPVVYRCVRMIAEAAGSLTWLAYEGDMELSEHPLLALLAAPNPRQSGPEFLEALYGHLLIAGNAYVEAVAIGDDVRELHVLRPDRMKVVPGADGWPEAYEYQVGTQSLRFPVLSDGAVRPVMHLALFHPADDHYGLSPLEAASASVDLHNAAGGWNKALLDNSARPSGALVYTPAEPGMALTGEQYERLKSELESGFQGAANAGRPLLLEGGLDWKSMGLSPKELDFIETKNAAAREIALAFGVPPTPITDGSHGKPWVFRNKDLKGWWSNPHINWPGGVESGAPTAWVPQSKPIWFTELGCPAVDKGANQPNVFIDPKSSESFLPHHSSGVRDDMMQRRFIEAHMRYWGSGDTEANPVSAVYGGPMVDPGAIHIWTWDARPFPAFPLLRDVWADGANWQLGHWLTGRLGSAPLAELVTAIMEAFGFTAFDVSGLRGIVDGYVIDSTMSVRQALEPLGAAFFFDGVESDGIIRFRHWGGGVEAELGIADLTEPAGPDGTLFELRRAQETELPRMARIGYSDSAADYRLAAAEAKRLVGGSSRVETSDVAMIMPLSQAQAIVDVSLQDAWAARETLMLSLPPSRLALEPGDTLSFDRGGGTAPATFQIVSISDGVERGIEARSIEASVFQAAGVPLREPTPRQPVILGPGILDCLDLPLIDGEGPAHAGYFAAFARPWHGQMAVLRSPSDTGFIVNRLITAPAIMGETLWDLHAGPQHRWDRGNRVQVTLYGGALHSADALAVLNGANRAAIRHPSGAWEIIQFRDAQLVAPDTYELSMLLRGQFGTGDAMGDPVPAGARFILLNAAVVPAAMSANDIGLVLNYRFGPAARDIADPAYRTLTHAFQGRGLRPLAPAHVKAVRPDGTADIALSWIRSTRIGGDAWEPVEVPLGEEQELYDLELIDPVSGSVVRTLSRLETAAYTYGAAAQMEDFGAVIAWPQALRVRVYQVAPSHGRGVPADVAIHFPLPVRMG